MTDPQTRVRDAIREYADAAPIPAGDVEAVLAHAKRQAAATPGRRRLRWLVPAGAGIAVATAIGVSLFVPRQEEPPAPLGVDWLPATIEKPSQPPAELPADKGVGPGSVIYSPCEEPNKPATCKEYLIAEDGTHYLIPGSSDKYGNEDVNATLSPDGRWLGVTRPGEFQLRDLTGARIHTVEGDRLVPLAWSPDSHWLVIGLSGAGPKPKPIWRLDTRTGETRQVTAPFALISRFVIDVTRAGEVLLGVPDARCRELIQLCVPHRDAVGEVTLVNPDKGEKPIWTRKLDGPPSDVDPEKAERPEAIRLTPDDGSLLVALGKSVEFPGGNAWAATSGDLVLFDLVTGAQSRRYDVIDGTVRFDMPNSPNPRPVVARQDQSWELLAHEGDGILLRGVTGQDSSEETETGRVDSRIAVVDPDSGEERIVTRAPGIKLIAVRGSINLAG